MHAARRELITRRGTRKRTFETVVGIMKEEMEKVGRGGSANSDGVIWSCSATRGYGRCTTSSAPLLVRGLSHGAGSGWRDSSFHKYLAGPHGWFPGTWTAKATTYLSCDYGIDALDLCGDGCREPIGYCDIVQCLGGQLLAPLAMGPNGENAEAPVPLRQELSGLDSARRGQQVGPHERRPPLQRSAVYGVVTASGG